MLSACSSDCSIGTASKPKKAPSKTAAMGGKRRRTSLGMVKAAIRALKEPAGSTPMSICKYIGSKFETEAEPDKVTSIVKKALKEGVEKKALVKPPNAANRYKINMSVERRRRRRRRGKGKKGKKGRRRRRRRRGRGKKGKKGRRRRRRRRKGKK